MTPSASTTTPAFGRPRLGGIADQLVPELESRTGIETRATILGHIQRGSFVAINNTVSQSVPHLHVHVIPRVKGDGLRGFFWPRTKYADEAEMEAVAERIRAAGA